MKSLQTHITEGLSVNEATSSYKDFAGDKEDIKNFVEFCKKESDDTVNISLAPSKKICRITVTDNDAEDILQEFADSAKRFNVQEK